MEGNINLLDTCFENALSILICAFHKIAESFDSRASLFAHIYVLPAPWTPSVGIRI